MHASPTQQKWQVRSGDALVGSKVKHTCLSEVSWYHSFIHVASFTHLRKESDVITTASTTETLVTVTMKTNDSGKGFTLENEKLCGVPNAVSHV